MAEPLPAYILRFIPSMTIFLWAFLSVSAAQVKQSEPVLDAKVKAGDGIPISISLGKTSPQNLSINVQYINTEISRKIHNPYAGNGNNGIPAMIMPPEGFFSCGGNSSPSQHEAVLVCTTKRTNFPGEYRAVDESFTFSRSETGDHQIQKGVRFPIVTIVAADPYDTTIFPEVLAASLSLDLRGSFFDAASRAQDILTDLGNHFGTTNKDTMANRAYLQGQVSLARSIIDLTHRRISGNTAAQQVPETMTQPMFEDFDRRLDAILQELAPRRAFLSHDHYNPRLIFTSTMQANRPQGSDSITVTPQKDSGNEIQKVLADFVEVLTDMSRGFLGIYKDGRADFTWSLTTSPAGAEIWYSRLNEPEVKWGGVSNQENRVLPKARWRFRISWSGCSKTVGLNPWLQNPIPLQEVKAGCEQHVGH